MTQPKLTQADAQVILNKFSLIDAVIVLGIRGYYKTTMGNPVKNDRGIYDDALFIISPDIYAAFNANTDPSIYRPHIASLKEGVWRYAPGIHHIGKPNAYPAFVQAAKVTVLRDGEGEDTGFFGINIHRGSVNSTSSEGCQTIYPAQWDSFYHTVVDQLKRYKQKSFPYVLVPAD